MEEARTRKLIGLLGLARRAGMLAVGTTAVEKLVRRGERPLVILAVDAGAALGQRAARWSPVRGVVADAVTSAQLAVALGRDKLSVVGTAAPDFVRGIRKLGF